VNRFFYVRVQLQSSSVTAKILQQFAYPIQYHLRETVQRTIPELHKISYSPPQNHLFFDLQQQLHPADAVSGKSSTSLHSHFSVIAQRKPTGLNAKNKQTLAMRQRRPANANED
jgi:hypothetical protein